MPEGFTYYGGLHIQTRQSHIVEKAAPLGLMLNRPEPSGELTLYRHGRYSARAHTDSSRSSPGGIVLSRSLFIGTLRECVFIIRPFPQRQEI